MHAIELGKVHPTAQVDPDASLGQNVTIGAFTTVGPGVRLGAGSVVGPYSTLGEPTADYYDTAEWPQGELVIGANARIRSHAVVYLGSVIGESFECGHRVTIREGADIGAQVRVGTLSDIQGDCHIGDYVRFHSNVHIGMKSVVKDYVWIFPYVVLTNDPHPPSSELVGVTVEEYAAIATMSVLLPGVTVGRDALVGAGSIVGKDVAAGSVVVGNPARQVSTVDKIKNRRTGEAVYPWRDHFDRGMPWEGIGFEKWKSLQTGS